jgi:hypothetical protein
MRSTDVSEVHVVSIFMIQLYANNERAWNRGLLYDGFLTIIRHKSESAGNIFPETSVDFQQTTLPCIWEDRTIHKYRYENFKS